MTPTREFRSLSMRTKLLLSGDESFDADFKVSIAGLESSDLVAFANSPAGGAILIGVKEIKRADGCQRGEVVGCQTGDKEKMSILSRAASCVPPITIDVFIENTRHKPFYRIEIPSGPHKPYCTSGGTYVIRGNGRNNALLPTHLLNLFVENQGNEFIEKFRKATQELATSLAELSEKTLSELGAVTRSLSFIDDALSSVFQSAQNAEGLSDEASSVTQELVSDVCVIAEQIENIGYSSQDADESAAEANLRLAVVLEKLGIEDPVMIRRRVRAKRCIDRLYGLGMRGKTLLQEAQSIVTDATEEELAQWYKDVLREIRRKGTTHHQPRPHRDR